MSQSALDRLASNGVINFDADSYVKGVPPRFIGKPTDYEGLPLDKPLMATPVLGVMPGPQLPGNPPSDAFVKHGKIKHPSTLPWKEILAGLTIGALALFTVGKAKNLIKTLSARKAAIGNKIPTWLKVTGGSLAAVLGLYAIYKFISRPKTQGHG